MLLRAEVLVHCSCDNHVCITKYQSPPDSPELDIDFVNKYNLIPVVNNRNVLLVYCRELALGTV